MDHIITNEEMQSLKALSDVNLKISEATNLLFKLQEEETEYLIEREKKALDRIQKVLETSQSVVQEANQNYGQIKELNVKISNFVQNLLKIFTDFQALQDEFNTRNVQWERDVGKQQDDLDEIRKEQGVIKNQLDNESKNLESARKKLVEDQRKLDSDRGTIERTIKRLQEGKI